jgi:hypothetical protein
MKKTQYHYVSRKNGVPIVQQQDTNIFSIYPSDLHSPSQPIQNQPLSSNLWILVKKFKITLEKETNQS